MGKQLEKPFWMKEKLFLNTYFTHYFSQNIFYMDQIEFYDSSITSIIHSLLYMNKKIFKAKGKKQNKSIDIQISKRIEKIK